MRIEGNVSVRPMGFTAFGTKVEVKNLNSFRSWSVRSRSRSSAIPMPCAARGGSPRAGDARLGRDDGTDHRPAIEGGGQRLSLLPGARSAAAPTVFRLGRGASNRASGAARTAPGPLRRPAGTLGVRRGGPDLRRCAGRLLRRRRRRRDRPKGGGRLGDRRVQPPPEPAGRDGTARRPGRASPGWVGRAHRRGGEASRVLAANAKAVLAIVFETGVSPMSVIERERLEQVRTRVPSEAGEVGAVAGRASRAGRRVWVWRDRGDADCAGRAGDEARCRTSRRTSGQRRAPGVDWTLTTEAGVRGSTVGSGTATRGPRARRQPR